MLTGVSSWEPGPQLGSKSVSHMAEKTGDVHFPRKSRVPLVKKGGQHPRSQLPWPCQVLCWELHGAGSIWLNDKTRPLLPQGKLKPRNLKQIPHYSNGEGRDFLIMEQKFCRRKYPLNLKFLNLKYQLFHWPVTLANPFNDSEPARFPLHF